MTATIQPDDREYFERHRVTVFGLGNMGAAVTRGATDAGLFDSEYVFGYDPALKETASGATLLDDFATAAVEGNVWVLAVKPHMVSSVLKRAMEHSRPHLVISVAAGVTLQTLRHAVADDHVQIVRTMPNMAAAERQAATAWIADGLLSREDDRAVRAFLRSFGTELELSDEKHMHAFTGAVGSGIAFAYLFAEALADAAVAEGLTRSLAREAAAATLSGAGAVLAASQTSPALHKDAVCSPGGTTIEGVATLEALGMRHAVIEAVRSAAQRSRELAGE